jgi:hypothetical protein
MEDFGGFKVTSSRKPDYPKPEANDIANVVVAKVAVKSLVARQR